MKILVCGGAGYIGAHMLRALDRAGLTGIALDNFSTGHRAALAGRHCHDMDLADAEALDGLFRREKFDAVMHFCAKSLVSESVSDPYGYYANNVTATLKLLAAMRNHGVSKLIFSSTCAIFGNPISERIGEEHPKAPVTPYGASKWMVERILTDAHRAYGLRSVALRYFNAAGAAPDGSIGESHHPETHLIPNVLRAALGAGFALQVFGNDYPTPDGTCIRDYIHVDDLADAHLRALNFIDDHDGAHAFNLGSEQGYSVLEVIESAVRVAGRPVPYDVALRRSGDPPRLVADSRRAREVLGWTPNYRELDPIMETAWRWHHSPAY